VNHIRAIHLRAGGPGHRLPHQPGVAAPWGPDKITEDGREQLRALGFNV